MYNCNQHVIVAFQKKIAIGLLYRCESENPNISLSLNLLHLTGLKITNTVTHQLLSVVRRNFRSLIVVIVFNYFYIMLYCCWKTWTVVAVKIDPVIFLSELHTVLFIFATGININAHIYH